MRRIASALVCGVLVGLGLLGALASHEPTACPEPAAGQAQCSPPAPVCAEAATATTGDPCAADDSPIDDAASQRKVAGGLSSLMKQNKTVKMSTLVGQLTRTRHRLALPAAAEAPLKAPGLYKRCRRSVLLVGSLYKCKKCTRWHTGVAGGFAIAPKGIIVTNYHVMDKPTSATAGAMTFDGKVYAVGEILAANKNADVAILKLKGADPPPLTLRAGAPVGTDVYVISHPDQKLYTLSEGILSRRFFRVAHGKRIAALSITADYAKGSSGAPVMDAAGAVVAMVATTHSVYYKREKGVDKSLQMVIRTCVPAKAILDCLSE